jgi:nucleolar protein 15
LKPEHLKSRGIIYIGHLPKGFEEDELKKFFTQFGKITKTRVSRSKKTGRTKGYAFIEFSDKEVAQIAVQTMNGYMMFHKQIECHIVEDPHKDTFKHGNREWNFIPTQVMFRNKKNAEKTDEQRADRIKGLLEKEKEKRIRIKELGIEYEFPGYQAIVDKQGPKKITKKVVKEAVVEEPVKKSKKSKVEPEVAEKPKKATKEIVVEEPKKSKKSKKEIVEEVVEPVKKSKKSKVEEPEKKSKKSKSKEPEPVK